MDKRVLGKSGIEVSPLGMGCMGITHASGDPMPDDEAASVVRQAHEMGYTFFDTAECYVGTCADGTEAHNEDVVGKALAPVRDEVVIATKFGVTHAPDKTILVDSRPEVIRISVEKSLRRLRTDHIDLYYQHRIDKDIEPEAVADTMARLIKEGKILHWGISEATEDYLRRAHKVCPVAAIQNRYSMMARWHESLFHVCEELGVGFVAFSPLANGLLSTYYTAKSSFDAKYDYRAVMPQYRKESFDQNKKLFELLNLLADMYHATPAQVSMAWMMSKKPWIVPIPGSRCICRLKENIGAADVSFTKEEVEAIDKTLDAMDMSEVFGGSRIVDKAKGE